MYRLVKVITISEYYDGSGDGYYDDDGGCGCGGGIIDNDECDSVGSNSNSVNKEDVGCDSRGHSPFDD